MRRFVKFCGVLLCLVLLVTAARVGYREVRQKLYPLEFRETVLEYAEAEGLDPAFVFSVIKCESGFDPQAVSSVGARGLMQITEDTFEWLQTKSTVPEDELLTYDAMFEPKTAIRYGCMLLGRIQQEFGAYETTLAAYHAGSSRVRGWLSDSAYSSDSVTLDHIPYDDTRSYVQRVMKTFTIYQEIYPDEF